MCDDDMSLCMRTTVRIKDELLERAKKHATRQGRTLTSLIEEGLVLVLSSTDRQPFREPVKMPVSEKTGGVLPGVDLNCSADLEDLMNKP